MEAGDNGPSDAARGHHRRFGGCARRDAELPTRARRGQTARVTAPVDAAARPSLGLLGVPTSAGSHNAGQEKAPGALRSAGLVDRLAGHGLDVEDFGDLPTQRHRPAPRVNGVRDLERVAAVAGQTATHVAELRAGGHRPLVMGGDCTITIGVLSGLAQTENVGLVYLDGDADLSTPQSSGSGVLDTMGMTHMLGRGAPALARLGPRYPLLGPEQVVLFGFDPAELDTAQWERLSAQHLHATPAPAVREDPAGVAAAACSHLEERVESILVHFDVDVLDTGAFPLANFPHFAGLSLEQVAICLERFCASPKFAGLIVTEVNPDHDPDGVLLADLVGTLSRALASAAGSRS